MCSISWLNVGEEEPMSTQPIGHKGYGYTLKQSRKPREDVDFPLGPEQSKKRQDESGEQRGDGLRARIRALLADVSTDGGSGISFQDILDHREMLERDWGDRMERDLRGLGVDMTRVFRLVNDPAAGSVTAGADHPDKMKIDQYFASNSEMVEDFERVLQLGKLSDTALRKLTVDEMGQELSVEAMAWWFQSNMEGASLFAGGGTVFGMGASSYKSLDIRV